MKRLAMKDFFPVLFLSSLMAFTGCASIVGKGAPQLVTINSTPSDANLKIEDAKTGASVYAGKTPYTATLSRGSGYFTAARYTVTIDKEGYGSRQFLIEGSPNGWYLGGNFIFGGLIGWLIVDPATGAMWTLSPEFINAELGTKASIIKTGDGLVIALKNDVPKELLNKMEPVSAK